MEENSNSDICRVCRCEGTPDKPLYHPCICTGSIKYIHQECLSQWLKYSEKEFCELCNYRYTFIPIYSPDMPQRLPLKDILNVIVRCLGTVIRYWLQYTLVAIAWLGIIPLTAYRIFMFLFNYSFDDILSYTFEFKMEILFSDVFYGCCVVMCTLSMFIFLIWLREQIIRIGEPEWLERPINLNFFQFIFRNDEVQRPIVDANNQPPPDNNNDHDGIDPIEAVINEDQQEDVDVEEVIDVTDSEDDDNENNAAPPPNNQVVAQDWNPVIEWDRGAEDITWGRILGLDGTFAFLENVFWAITLNTLFIFIFAYCPFHIGNILFRKLRPQNDLVSTQFDRFIIIYMGYLIIGALLYIFHTIFSMTRLTRLQRSFGFCYIIVKVALLVTLEIGLFPMVVGWWLDICSLPLFNMTVANRIESFFSTPGTSLFIHWLIGMVCIFYFVSFVLMVKEVVRPGILWFIRNLNDPNFSPVNEMIHLSLLSHLQRCVISLALFCTLVLLCVHLPIVTIQRILPSFLPYNNVSYNDSPWELIIQLFIFRFLIPNMYQADNRDISGLIKTLIKNWCRIFSYILGLKSYLLGDDGDDVDDNNQQRDNNAVDGEEEEEEVVEVEIDEDGEAGDNIEELQQQLQDESSPNNYQRPRLFMLRIAMLLISFCSTLFFFGVLMLTVPIYMGRAILKKANNYVDISEIRLNEFYTATIGIYVIYGCFASISDINRWIKEILRANSDMILKWFSIGLKLAVSSFFIVGLIPLLAGLLFDVVLLIPLRVPLNQTPIFYIWQDYAFGILLSNVVCVIRMMSDARFKNIMERIYNNGFQNTNLQLILSEIAIPHTTIIGLMLIGPYLSVSTILPLVGASFEVCTLFQRRIHSILLLMIVLFFFGRYQINKLINFYQHIRNDKYLVGRRLVNYEHGKSSSVNSTATTSSTAK